MAPVYIFFIITIHIHTVYCVFISFMGIFECSDEITNKYTYMSYDTKYNIYEQNLNRNKQKVHTTMAHYIGSSNFNWLFFFSQLNVMCGQLKIYKLDKIILVGNEFSCSVQPNRNVAWLTTIHMQSISYYSIASQFNKIGYHVSIKVTYIH